MLGKCRREESKESGGGLSEGSGNSSEELTFGARAMVLHRQYHSGQNAGPGGGECWGAV